MIIRSPNPVSRSARRGISALLLVLAWSCVVACMALALDLALVFYQGRQLQTACESAAFAGAAELFDPAALTPDGLMHWLATAGSQAYSTNHQQQLHTAAFHRAKYFAAANRAGGREVELQIAIDDDKSDAIAGVVADPTEIGSPLVASSDVPGLRSNSLLVRTSRAAERGNPVTLWFGQMLGMEAVDLTASTRASLDQRVYGLQPAGHVRVPLVPVVVLPDEDGSNAWIRQATEWCNPTKNDRVAIHRHNCEVRTGADGIPEIELTLPLGEKPTPACNARMVQVTPLALTSPQFTQQQIANGYDAQDLAGCGGAIWLDSVLPAVPAQATDGTGLAQALDYACGQKRIWLLGVETPDGYYQVTGFAAGQTIEVEREANGLRITLQPCQLTTCTAATGVAGPANPWIGKLLRSE